jgi:urate oxidase
MAMGQNRYGKSGIRLVKVVRHPDRHELRDLTVDVSLEGDFDAVHLEGDNTGLVATDTMRNAVYALARQHELQDIESFALTLVDHFLDAGPRVTGARIAIAEHPWERLGTHEHAFQRGSGGRAIAIATAESLQAGIEDLTVLKTTESGFEGFHKDRFTTLEDTTDRILATTVSATWTYRDRHADFGRIRRGAHEVLLRAFADHYSPSVQYTLHRMGEAVLEPHPQIERIHLSLPNRHHLLVDLSPFGLSNDNQVFQATTEPYGLIEGTVERSGR